MIAGLTNSFCQPVWITEHEFSLSLLDGENNSSSLREPTGLVNLAFFLNYSQL